MILESNEEILNNCFSEKILKDFPFKDYKLIMHPMENHVNFRIIRAAIDSIIEEKGKNIINDITTVINKFYSKYATDSIKNLLTINDPYYFLNISNAIEIMQKQYPFSSQDIEMETLWMSYEAYQLFNWTCEIISKKQNFLFDANIKGTEKDENIKRLVKSGLTPELSFKYAVPKFARKYNNTILLEPLEVIPGKAVFKLNVVNRFIARSNVENFRRGETITQARLCYIPTLFGLEKGTLLIHKMMAYGDKEGIYEIRYKKNIIKKYWDYTLGTVWGATVGQKKILEEQAYEAEIRGDKYLELSNTLEEKVRLRTNELFESNEQLLRSNLKLEKEIKNRRIAETARINAEKAAAIAEYGKSMGGALAHEIGNSTQTSAFRINAMDSFTKDEYGNPCSLEVVLEEKIAHTATALFELEKHGLGREIIIKHILPHLQEIDQLREYTFQSVKILKQTIGRDMTLAQKFLEYSKLGEIKRGIDLINLSELLNTLNMCYTPDLEKNNIDMIISMENDMDISGDYTQLESVFSNLIKNAIEAFEGTNITNRVIKISGKRISKENGKYIQVSVSDNGKGIPKEQQKDIFKPFKTSKPTKGTGLGLNLAQRIVNAYGGSINFNTTDSKGTTFIITIKK